VPLKCKNPGCPIMLIMIGNHNIVRVLFDLGASVNFLSFTVYEGLGLGEIKPTKMVLQLVNYSTKLSGGMVEDVLVKVQEFIFPVDFAVLETEVVLSPKIEIPVILSPPFLATSNTLINYRDGVDLESTQPQEGGELWCPTFTTFLTNSLRPCSHRLFLSCAEAKIQRN